MTKRQKQAFLQAMRRARQYCRQGRWEDAFSWLEQAHILGQGSTMAHMASHWWMLKVGWWRRDWHEVRGQLLRLPAALLMSRLWVPAGNTGGANVGALTSLPLPAALAELMEGE